MGRTAKPIDADQVEKLSALGCTIEDIADFFGIDKAQICRRFSQSLTRGRAREKMSIRRKRMLRAVKDGSDAMLIYLSKVRLGENDRHQTGQLGNSEATDADGNQIDP